MDRRSLALLEFTLVRERLAAATGFAVSRRSAEALEPSPDRVIVERALSETDEARAFLGGHPGAGIGRAVDIGPAIERADRGGRLEIGQLLEILATLEAAGRLAEALNGERRPLLRELGRRIAPLPLLRGRLEQSLDPAGELLDGASPALGGLRRAVRLAYERLRARLDQLVHSAEVGKALQEPIVTLRGGRYVVPVRAEARSRVRGIVHDQSGSGQTLFVEPLVAVELGNAWREAGLAVEVEEERILDELSGLVATQAGLLRSTLAALGDFDLWAAKARLAGEMDAIRAETASSAEIILLSARHPGLSGRVVPIDVRLGDGVTALVITGPNTGGKTVALRTIGLLTLMHQAGLHVPAAPGSRLPVLKDVFADIGDEQSVAQSLSTFSGHLRSIVRIVEAAGPDSLVLLDELGAGTDPTEGSALAQAILDHFVRVGALVVATTHYPELKTYAHNTEAVRNASVEFDLETLSPTYRLTIGLPGTSQAFAIAERLGLPPDLVTDARSRLSRAQLEFEATLASIKAAQETAAAAVGRARVAEARAEEIRQSAAVERARARRERDDAFSAARAEAERALAALREEIRGARSELAAGTASAERLDQVEARLEASLAAIPRPADRGRHRPEVVPSGANDPWALGMIARTAEGWEGRIVSLDGERATLEAGQLRIQIPVAGLEAVAPSGDGAAGEGGPRGERSAGPRSGRRGEVGPEWPSVGELTSVRGPAGATHSAPGRGGSGPATPAAASMLDLRGARVEEALEALEAYLDRAAAMGLGRATIVHGHGSGALRDAVRAVLADHPLVNGWRPGERGEGGDGATIVTF